MEGGIQPHPCCLFGRKRKNVEGNSAHGDSSAIVPASMETELKVSELIEAEGWT